MWFAFANICTNNKYADAGFIHNFPQDWPQTNGRTFEQRKSINSYIYPTPKCYAAEANLLLFQVVFQVQYERIPPEQQSV